MAMQPLTGDDPAQIGGYRLSAVLGTGGMGRVYLAFTPGGRPVAIKVVRPELGNDDEFRARFSREVDAARQVPALYTAQVIDADPAAAQPWVVTSYLPGPSLAESVADHGPMPPGTVFLLVAGLAEALRAIHATGVIHRDLKPSNILLAPDGPRIIDFGIARALAATMMTRSSAILGSTPFMAPEQAAGQPVTTAADVFALGSLAAYAATGRMPFAGENDAVVLYRVVHADPDLDGCQGPLRELIDRCLAKAAADRPEPAEIVRSCQSQLTSGSPAAAHDWLAPGIAAALAVPGPGAGDRPAPGAGAALGVPGPGAGDWPAPGAGDRPAPGAGAALGVPGPGAGDWPVPGVAAGLDVPGPGTSRPTSSLAIPPVPAQPPPGRTKLDRARRSAGAGYVRSVPRTVALLGLAAALLIAGTFGVADAVLSHAGQSGKDKHATDANAPVRARHRSARSAAPSPSTTPSAADCLIGRWISTSENITGTVSNNSVIYTGPGPIETYSADGTATTTYHNRKFSTTVNGVRWTQVVNGGATFHYEIQNGMILVSDIKAHGTSTLLENGAYNNGGPFTIVATPERFSCSGNTLREYPSNGSVVSTRAAVNDNDQSTGS